MIISQQDAFQDLIGQDNVVERLRHYASATGRLPNLLITAPPGNGKTKFARAFVKQAGAKLFEVNAGSITDGITLNYALRPAVQWEGGRAVIFIDEAHGLKRKIQIDLLTGMETPYVIYTPIKMGRKTRTYAVRIPEHVSFVMSTTDQGKLTKALLSRMIKVALDEYDQSAMETICKNYLQSKGFHIDDDAAAGFARVSRSPRQLIQEVCGTAIIYNNRKINEEIFKKVIAQLRLTESGLTTIDTKLLNRLATFPYVSERNLIAFLQVEKEEYSCNIEPWLIKRDLIQVSTHGRGITNAGLREIGMDQKINSVDIVGELID